MGQKESSDELIVVDVERYKKVKKALEESKAGDRSEVSPKLDEKESTRELVVVDVRRYKKVKKALKESEERYRQLFENVPIGIYRTTPDGRIIDSNPALVNMLGFESFTDLATRNLEKDYVVVDLPRADFVQRLKRDGEIKGLEAVWKKKDGSLIHVRENAKLIRDEDGQVFFEGTVEDITQRKLAEEARRIRTQQMEILNCIISSGNLAESMAEILDKTLEYVVEPLAFDTAGIYMYNPETKKVNLLARRGAPSHFHLLDDYMAIDKMPFSQVLLRGQSVFVDHVRNALPDLTERWGWQMVCTIPLVSKGRIVGALALASCKREVFTPEEKNILELIGKEAGTLISKLQTEIALRESEKYYRTLIDTSPDIIFVVDFKGTMIMVNQRFLQISGFFYDEIVGHNVLEFVKGVKLAFFLEGIKKFIKTKKLGRMEYPIKKKDGTFFPMEMALSLLTNELAVPSSIMGVGRDISERKQAEKLTAALYKISQAVYSTKNLNELFKHIHLALSGIIPAANLFIALLSDDGKTLTFPYVVDEKDANAAPVIQADDSQSLTVEVLTTKRSLLLDEAELNERYAAGRNRVWGTAPKCWLGVPLMIRETAIGVMAVQDYQERGVYSLRDVTLLESAAGQIAIAIDRKRTEFQREAALGALRQSEETFRRTFEAIPDPAYVWVRQGGGRFILSKFNRAAALVNKNIKSLIGIDLQSYFAAYPEYIESIRSGLEKGASQNVEFLYRYNSSGESRWLLADSAKTSPDSVLVITKDITERKRTQLDIEEKNKVLAILNQISLELALLPPATDINKYISKKLMKITHAIYVGVNYYNKDTRQLEFVNAHTANKILNEVNRVLGTKIGNIKYDVSEAMYKEITSEIVGYRKTLYETSFGAISEKTSSMIQHLFNIDAYIGMALVVEGELIGTVIMAITQGTPAVSLELLKSLSSIISVSLRRRQAEKQLVTSEEKFKKLFYISPDSIILSRLHDRRIVSVNKGFTKIMGYKECEVVGKTTMGINIFKNPEEYSKIIDALKIKGVTENIESWFVNRSGKNILGLVSAAVIEIDGEKYMMSTIRDITEHKRAEQELRESKALLDAVVDNVPLMVFLKEARDLKFVIFNRAGEELLGYDRDLMLGKSDSDFFPAEQAAFFMAKDREALAGEADLLDIPLEPIMTAKKGQRLLHTRKVCIQGADGAKKYLLGISEDITERKEAEGKLLAYQEQLQALTSELILIEEKERRRIASELHDQIGQNLALCKLKVAALEKDITPENAKGELSAIRRLLECSIQDARSLIFDLSPPVLYELGFRAALEWLAEMIEEQYHVPVEFEDRSGGEALESNRQVILFQIVRELLVNVGKHSQAKRAKVILSLERPFLKIQINDDGVGFDTTRIYNTKSGGFGFFSMRERLQYLGGGLEVRSKPGQGTQIILTVPQSTQERENS